jgi:C-terminal of Roc, COR, domain/Ras of Complex, Roc, domain of DAPkinase/Protein kinase domain
VRPFRLRVMVVGTANAGKTTLVKRLVDAPGTLEMTSSRSATFGVDVVTWETDWPVGGGDDSHITVTIYDFAGQPEYHPTHEMFLAPDVLFVVVVNLKRALVGDLASINAEALRMEAWMRLIASRAPGARLLVVGTHVDSSKVDCVAVQSGFASAMKTESTRDSDAKTNQSAWSPSERLGRILASVLSLTARQTGLRIQAKELFVVDALHDKAGDFVAFKTAFRDLATTIVGERDSVPASIFEMVETTSELSTTSPVMSLSAFKEQIEKVHDWYEPIVPLILRSAGVMEYFADVPGLEDDVFLSPEWLAKMLAAIVDERRGHGACVDGIVDAATLHRLWCSSGQVEDERMRAALVRVMRAFGLLHPVDSAGERFVMSSLLSEFPVVSSRPEVSSLLSRLAEAPRVLRRVYTFSVFPSGLLPRTFSRLHGVRDGNVLGWLTGLVFEMSFAGLGSLVSSTTGLLRADVSHGAELVVSATHDELFSVFEKALLVVRDVTFVGLQVFRDGTPISVAPAQTPDAQEGGSGPEKKSSPYRDDRSDNSADNSSGAAWGSSQSENRLVVDLGVPVWDPLQFEVRAASPPVPEIDVARDLEPRGIQLGSGSFGTVEQRVASATSRALSPGSSYALKLPNYDCSSVDRASFEREYQAMRHFAMRCQHLAALVGVEFGDSLSASSGADGGSSVTAILMPLYDSSLDKIVAGRVFSCDREVDEWFDAEEDIMLWFRQICLGVRVLHDAGVAHLDLKTGNVFARLAGATRYVSCLAVGDFGTAFEVVEGSLAAQAGTNASLRVTGGASRLQWGRHTTWPPKL